MKNKGMILLRTMLLSTSVINRLKTCKDRKKRGKIIGAIVGLAVLYAMLIGYCVLMAVGYGYFGLADEMPALTAIVISIMAFMFTLIKAGSYLFGFKEYDMLMALPFTEKTIAGSRFLYMYIKSLPLSLSISLSFMIGYGIFSRPAVYVYIIWIVLAFFLPMIPTLIASFLAFLITRIGMLFKHWKIVQTILTFVLVILAFLSRFFFEKLFRENKIEDIVTSMASYTSSSVKYYPPAAWFSQAINRGSISDMLLLAGISIVLFEVVFFIFARSYKMINSTMKTGTAKRNFKLKESKKKSHVRTMAAKEIKRFFGSTTYLVNMGIGYMLAVFLGIAALIAGLDRIISTITEGAPVTVSMIRPAIPFVVYFMTGMMPLTTSSPSLEGKNYWIIKSFPLTNKEIYGGKILANLYISIPAQLVSTLLMCVAAKAGIFESGIYMLLGVVLCIFSAVFGCACGIHFMKLEWENEVEVVKQGAAVVVYMFPNMILTMIMVVACVIVAGYLGTPAVVILSGILYGLLSLIFYHRVNKLAAKV